MLVVKVEIWPKGDPSKARSMGTAMVWLTGARRNEQNRIRWGRYKFRLLKWGRKVQTNLRGIPKSAVWKEGEVENHDRIRRGPWDLLLRVLHEAVISRNRDLEAN